MFGECREFSCRGSSVRHRHIDTAFNKLEEVESLNEVTIQQGTHWVCAPDEALPVVETRKGVIKLKLSA
jgi:hypothetical protein